MSTDTAERTAITHHEGGAATHEPETWTLRLASGLVIHTPPTLRSLSTYVLMEQEQWFEPEMSLLPHLLAGGQGQGVHALDIGANHGVVALEMARLMSAPRPAGTPAGPPGGQRAVLGRPGAQPAGDGHVWAFEPTAVPRAALERSVVANGFSSRITVVAAGLADLPGTARFNVQENSELNSRHGNGSSGSRHETVQLTTLDRWQDSLEDSKGGAAPTIGFVKLDAEGDEVRVLAGGRRFFERQSPVVLFELKHGAAVNHALLGAWHALGYEVFRWSAELGLLRPFDAAGDELAFALNLVAARPAQQAELAVRGLLATVEALEAAELPPAPRAGLSLFEHALSWWATAHFQAGLTAAQRLLSLLQAFEAAAALNTLEAGVLRLHALHALGRQHAAVTLGAELLARWGDAALPDLVAPPLKRDLHRTRSTSTAAWLKQLVGEYVATHSAYSAYFMPPGATSAQPWAALMQHPDHDAGIERRWLLAHASSDQLAPAAGLAALARLPHPEHTANPGLWRGLIESMRAMAGASVSPEAVLDGLGDVTVQVVDVGAAPLGDVDEPYAPLLRAGRAKVIAFEPDRASLAALSQRYAGAGTHRCLPDVVGDGDEATFHRTAWSLTSSLFEPDRALLDRWQLLGEVVQEAERVAVPTVRLDDVIEPGAMDLLKIDVQGGELKVFDGARKRLAECLVVWTEAEFVPLYRGQPLFADIDQHLRAQGFQFFCFHGLASRQLASWPVQGMTHARHSQQLWADAIYVPTPERIDTLNAGAAARLALIAHHVLGAWDLCHVALQRHDGVTGGALAPRYGAAQKA